MTLLKIARQILFISLILILHSCFLIKIPLKLQATAIKDTVHVYHLIVTGSPKKLADTLTVSSFTHESKKAFDWLTKEAKMHKQNVIFKEYWLANKDTTLKYNFIHKLPNNSLQELTRKRFFCVITRKKTRTQDEKVERVNWNKRLFDSLSKQVKDTGIVEFLTNKSRYKQSDNRLIMVHLLRVKKSRILGFYEAGRAFIGNNKSVTIAHETIHYLGAPDLYIHRYWFGKRRRMVRKELRQEIMDFTIGKNYDCTTYFISNYTAYTLNWDKNLEKQYKPLLRQNLMAKILFYLGLFS